MSARLAASVVRTAVRRVASVSTARCTPARTVFGFVAPVARRFASDGATARPEVRMEQALRQKLGASFVRVNDTSGGCGSFYQVTVVSPAFEGKTAIKQHKAVNEVLEADIGKMHGLTIKTMTPAQFEAMVAAQGGDIR